MGRNAGKIILTTMRAGTYISQPTGYRAFIPADLPPDPPIQMDATLIKLLSDADRALGRLNGVATILRNLPVLIQCGLIHAQFEMIHDPYVKLFDPANLNSEIAS